MSQVARRIQDEDLQAIERAVRSNTEAMTAQQIADALKSPPPRRTLQYRLKTLVDRKYLSMKGEGRWARYSAPRIEAAVLTASGRGELIAESDAQLPLSKASTEIQQYVRKPPAARLPTGYNRSFLDRYRPNITFYLKEQELAHLASVGRLQIAEQPAGTYAKQILSRLLIDLSWNSSRLEGNTYSLLDTKRLIELGEEAEGRTHVEAQMILNHKDAIEFLVSAADEIGFNRYTILNLHAILANNLLGDATAAGRLRYIAVGIERSAFHPLEVPQLIEEAFDQVLATAAAIANPFEQAFFIMVQLPYLQPFDDVNKRVSRLAANIPLIKGNFSPLSFEDVPRRVYTEAVLGIYELNKIDFLKDVFIWAYERSAARYAAVRQSLGEPDPFRLHFRAQLREIIADLVRSRVGRKEVTARIAAWSNETMGPSDRKRFNEVVKDELTSLHEGNFVRYQIRPSEFAAWREVWKEV